VRVLPYLIVLTHQKYSRLSFLFNSIPQKSGLRLTVFNVLLTLASSRDELEVLQISRPEVEKWIKDWDVTSEQKSEFLKRLTDAFANADEP
jgi:translation initiation factor 3 subunit M